MNFIVVSGVQQCGNFVTFLFHEPICIYYYIWLLSTRIERHDVLISLVFYYKKFIVVVFFVMRVMRMPEIIFSPEDLQYLWNRFYFFWKTSVLLFTDSSRYWRHCVFTLTQLNNNMPTADNCDRIFITGVLLLGATLLGECNDGHLLSILNSIYVFFCSDFQNYIQT